MSYRATLKERLFDGWFSACVWPGVLIFIAYLYVFGRWLKPPQGKAGIGWAFSRIFIFGTLFYVLLIAAAVAAWMHFHG